MTWFDLLRGAGIDPTSAKWTGCPFETVAADPTCEIVEDRRNGDLWLLDHSNTPEDADDVVDCPVRRATDRDMHRVNQQREEALKQKEQG